MTHSEGPYTIERWSKGQINIMANDGNERVASVDDINENAEGNAYLLAESWAMKEALKAWVLASGWKELPDPDSFDLDPRVRDAWVKTRAVFDAISTAKGEGV